MGSVAVPLEVVIAASAMVLPLLIAGIFSLVLVWRLNLWIDRQNKKENDHVA